MRTEQTADVASPRWSQFPLVRGGTALWRRAAREARVTYGVIWRDLSVTVIPGSLMCLTALHAAGALSLRTAALALGKCLLYFLLHVYVFTIDNQILGHEEDRVNKPDRVLPSGFISLPGARRRREIAMVLFPLVGWLLGGVPFLGYALGWIVLTIAYNHWGLHRHWVTKNLVFITLYAILLLAPAWQLAAPLDETGIRMILVISAAMGLTLNLQDFRDVTGDVFLKRRTLPLAIGERPARWLIASSIALLPLAVHFGLVYPRSLGPAGWAAEGLLAGLNLLVAVRTLRLHGPRVDHKTYMLHTYWFCGVLASGLVLL